MAVVAAVDKSDAARGVVREAATLATALGEELHVIHVMSRGQYADLQRESIIEERHGRSVEDVESEAAEVSRRAAEGIAESATMVGRIGEPGKQVVEYADEVGASYLVVGGRDRSPVGKVIFGSVTQAILLAADAPVITVIEPEDD